MADIPPNQTLYIRNLNEKTKKEELKKSLYALFSQHGQILDVVAMKTTRMRGQAFIVYKEISSATQAMRAFQGFNFYEKPMMIQFAKGKSFVVAKEDGSLNDLKRKRDDEKDKETREPKRRAVEKPRAPKESAPVAARLLPEEEALPPNKILFVQNLPEDSDADMIKMIFSQFPGFLEVRLVPGKSDISFVEFENEVAAAVAKDNLQNFKVTTTNMLKITFAKRS